ncbi:phospholipid-translocating ATPase [Entomortierella parvispora]|uniref:Phospholipid-translocating ATPase n=1 Tax=Entomortierella parvispora TaxID=205924 RepID=A0A9P3HCA7_9FUNG|nr:phospholipid-translocating ATPase [Entomortierella parvispora]
MPPPSHSRKLHPLRSLFAFSLLHKPPLPKTKQVHVNLDPDHASLSEPSPLSPTGQDPRRPPLTLPSTHASSPLSPQQDDVGRITSNKVVTTQYSILTFLPKNLYHQFRRVANFFFLMIVILQCIRPFQSMEPAVSALPLMIIVGLTAARDGFEDWKRHEVDETVNTRTTLALHNWKNRTMEQKLAHHYHCRHRSKYARYLYQESTPAGALSGGGHHQSKSSWIAERILIMGRFLKRPMRSLLRCIRSGTLIRAFKRFKARFLNGAGNMDSDLQDTNDELDRSDSELQEPAPKVIGYSYRRSPADPNAEGSQLSGATGELYQLVEEPPENDLSFPYWRPRLWQDVQEGDLILLQRNDFIPADLLILSSSEPEPICYVETMNLDGETNLKIRQCIPGLGPLYTPEECTRIKFWVDSEGPNNNLLKYHGAVVFPADPETGAGARRVGIDLNHLLLRGCVLRNTEWVIGLVIFTGADTKLQMNSGRVPSKRSDMERKMNFQMMSIITFQNLVPVALYLTVEGVKTIQAYFIYQDLDLYYEKRDIPCMPRSWNLSDDLGQIEYIFSDKTGTLTTNQMEFKKCSIQGQVFDFTPSTTTTVAVSPVATTDQQHENPTGIHESLLGKDPTSQHGYPSFDNKQDPFTMEILGSTEDDIIETGQESADIGAPGMDGSRRHRSSPNTLVDWPQHDSLGLGIEKAAKENDEGVQGGQTRSRNSSNATAVLEESAGNPLQFALTPATLNSPGGGGEDGSSNGLQDPDALQGATDDFFLILSICHTVLVSTVVAEKAPAAEERSFQTPQFIGTIRIPSDTDYQAQSPDELALVVASKGLGYTFLGREVDVILMAHPREQEPRRYQILNVLEFNSTRKRMSIIVKRLWPESGSTRAQNNNNEDHDEHQEGEILLLTKGADNIIFERLAGGQDQIVQDTTAHFQSFARDGLRTLCLAYKLLDPTAYSRWADRYHFASTFVEGSSDSTLELDEETNVATTNKSSQSDQIEIHPDDQGMVAADHGWTLRKSFKTTTRQEMLEELGEEMERDLILLGGTGIEDRLQDGVPETIRLLKRAGIKVWMLTGDKMETAISIGVSTGLLSQGSLKDAEDIGQIPLSKSRTDSIGRDGLRDLQDSAVAQKNSSSSLVSEDTNPDSEEAPPCSDIELVLIRGDYEPEKYPLHSSHRQLHQRGPSDRDAEKANHPVIEQNEHPVMAQIRTALSSFKISQDPMWDLTRATLHDAQAADYDRGTGTPSMTEKSETTEQGGSSVDHNHGGPGSSYGDYLPWRMYERWEPPTITKPFLDSISSIKRRATTATFGGGRKKLIQRQSRNTALVIDGLALKFALEDPACKELLVELACECSAVVCCRVSPLQKAMVVKMVKDSKKVMTLSIGDGANDVSMIQEAHIGIGVAGEEGLQAVMASDYSIGQFRFLARLLLVHGHYAYLRNSSMVMLFIYKNIIGIGALFCYEFVCGFSSVPAFEYSYILLYNVVFTVFPPLIIGIFDRDIGPGVLMTFPELYKVGLLQEEFTNARFLIYSLEGIFQSILCFVIPYFSYQRGSVESSGRIQEMYEMGLAMAVSSIAQANIFAAVVSQSFSGFHVLFIWGSVALIFVYSALYAMLPRALSQANPNYQFQINVMATATFWAVVVLTIVCCNIPRLTARYIRRMYHPKDLDILQEICHMRNMDHRVLVEGMSEMHPTPSALSGALQQSNRPPTTSSVHVEWLDPGIDSEGKCKTLDTRNASTYRALGRHLRLDWTWGLMPASAPAKTRPIVAYPSEESVIPSVVAASMDTNRSEEPEVTNPPEMREQTVPAMLSPSLRRHPSVLRSREGPGGLGSPSSAHSSGSTTNNPGLRRLHTPADDDAAGSDILDSTNPSMILRRQHLQQVRHRLQEEGAQSLKSASPTFVDPDPQWCTIGIPRINSTGTHIGVSDPLSSKPPTPILGFGFAQEEGMADLILGTRFYNQRQANRGSSASIGQQSGLSSSSGGLKQSTGNTAGEGSMKVSAHKRNTSTSSTGTLPLSKPSE